MDRESQDVKIGAVECSAANITDPFLDAISSGFIERSVMIDVEVDLVVGEFTESDVCAIDKGHNPTRPSLKGGGFFSKSDGSIDLVGFSGKSAEHGKSFFGVMRFAEHLVVTPDDGVGCDE